MLSAGAIHPALPQEAPAPTPVRSTTLTETPRSCRNQAVDNPTMPAPTTIADRGSTITDLLDAAQASSDGPPVSHASDVPWPTTRVSGANIQTTPATSKTIALITNPHSKPRC